MNQPSAIAAMPAYNVEKTLERTYQVLPNDPMREAILVDAGSRDASTEVATQVLRRGQNPGVSPTT